MPNYLTPGVYVEEVPSTSKPIEGVGTSVAAFVGLAPGGPVNRPMRISNWTEFARVYGDPVEPENGPFMPDSYLAHAVYGFFQNGGTLCWVVRVGAEEGASTARAALPAAQDKSVETFRASALEAVDGEVKVELSEEEPQSTGRKQGSAEGGGASKGSATYRLEVTGDSEQEVFENLTLRKGRNNIATKVNSQSKLIKIEETGASLPDDMRVPATGTYELEIPAAPPKEVGASDFEGDVARREGMGALAAIDEVNTICVPDLMAAVADGRKAAARDLQAKMIAACEVSGDRMAILDPPLDLLPQDLLEWRNDGANFDSKFAALYYPWLEVNDPISDRPILVPPCGHMAGVWARTDGTRGVHKAPANEVVQGVTGLAFQVTQAEQGRLNQLGVNCIRAFPARGIRVWGARTLSSDPEWRYVNVRRLFNYISRSLIEGTQWAVFEPNDERLWLQLRVAASNFLRRSWRDGALFGATPDEAFFVKCDAETNPPEVIEAGQVVIEVGIAPVKPAEFVVFRISQFAAGAAEVTA